MKTDRVEEIKLALAEVTNGLQTENLSATEHHIFSSIFTGSDHSTRLIIAVIDGYRKKLVAQHLSIFPPIPNSDDQSKTINLLVKMIEDYADRRKFIRQPLEPADFKEFLRDFRAPAVGTLRKKSIQEIAKQLLSSNLISASTLVRNAKNWTSATYHDASVISFLEKHPLLHPDEADVLLNAAALPITPEGLLFAMCECRSPSRAPRPSVTLSHSI